MKLPYVLAVLLALVAGLIASPVAVAEESIGPDCIMDAVSAPTYDVCWMYIVDADPITGEMCDPLVDETFKVWQEIWWTEVGYWDNQGEWNAEVGTQTIRYDTRGTGNPC